MISGSSIGGWKITRRVMWFRSSGSSRSSNHGERWKQSTFSFVYWRVMFVGGAAVSACGRCRASPRLVLPSKLLKEYDARTAGLSELWLMQLS